MIAASADVRRRPQYGLRALFALVTAVSVPLGFWASREHAYRALLANVAPLVEDGRHVRVEKRGGSPESSRNIDSVRNLERDDIVVGASCDTADTREVAAILALPTLKELRLLEPGPEAVPVTLATLKKMGQTWPADRVVEVGSSVLCGDELPLGAIDPTLRAIASTLRSLERLELVATSVSGEGLRHLTSLRSLRSLDLSRTRISDADLAYIPAMRALDELILDGTGPNRYVHLDSARLANVRATSYGRRVTSGHEISDEGIRRLAGASRLRVLRLREAKVSGVGFKDLASFTRLEDVNLYDTDFDDEGARYLAALPSIQSLDLTATKITSAALADISSMHRLSTLSLWATAVEDAALRHLARLPCLSRLNLRETRITDAGLIHLAGLPSLKTVDLAGANLITSAGTARLQALRPGLKIAE